MSKKDAATNGFTAKDGEPQCFVIMPISEVDGYEARHFSRVYQDIFRPACKAAGYEAFRADEVRQTNLIHLDILHRIINARWPYAT